MSMKHSRKGFLKMKRIKVNLGNRSYDIIIGKNVMSKLSLLFKNVGRATPVFAITNSKVLRLHKKKILSSVSKLSKDVMIWKVPDSETAKSFSEYERVVNALAKFARKTKPIIIAIGGGVVGDLSGFVASTYRRGVPYIQIPTTLLAQVDSAIGGKVAIDIKEAMNIIGSFYQPSLVICDIDFLDTLSIKELQNGMAEVVKYGVIQDASFFAFLEKNIEKALKLNHAVIEKIISVSCRIKASIVEQDEYDSKDVRAILNFGHTIGHAIEASLGYKNVSHGNAVAIGMILASRIALKRKLLDLKNYTRICSLVTKILPSGLPRIKDVHPILKAMAYDKKFIKGYSRFVLPTKIGCVKIIDGISDNDVKSVIIKGV